MTREITAEHLHGILEGEAVSRAIEQVAAHDKALVAAARGRAHEALQVAVELAENAGRDVSDEALTSITVCAVESLLPGANEFGLHHRINGWLGGPSVVPTNLRFSWEGKGKKPTPAPSEITEVRAGELVDMQNAGALATQAVLDAEGVHRAIGQLEALDFLRHVADIATAQIFEGIKHNKKYKGLPYRDAEGNLRHVATLEEFCEAKLGRSYRRVKELADNLHVLGPALYESAEAIGFKARDYAALKALPAEEQEVVKQALAAESKDQVLDILQDLAARHQSERAAAKKQTEDLQADLDARDRLLTDKSEKVDKLALELQKLKDLPPNQRARLQLEQEQAAAERINTACVKAEGALAEFLGEVADVLALDGVSMTSTTHAMNAVRFLGEIFADAVASHNIDLDFEGMVRPEWRRSLASDDLGLQEAQG